MRRRIDAMNVSYRHLRYISEQEVYNLPGDLQRSLMGVGLGDAGTSTEPSGACLGSE